MKIRRAIISVSDKTGLLELARLLHELNVEILATGGTAKALMDHEIAVRSISEYTGFPEIMDGRVKTLHPKIHGGILFRRDNPAHVEQARQNSIEPIDLVIINLYPFQQTIAKSDVTLAEAIEQIDIGGPGMIRAAAKNYTGVAVVVDPADYPALQAELQEHRGELGLETRQKLAARAFQHTASYDTAIAQYLTRQCDPSLFPEQLILHMTKVQDLRYGENPHQQAAVYREQHAKSSDLIHAEQLAGKELSFNNFLDMDGAYGLIREFSSPACAIIKHSNPCGVGLGKTLLSAYEKALATDPQSAFGGIIAFNREVDTEAAETLLKVFTEVILAPAFSPAALEVFKRSKNLRLMTIPNWEAARTQTELDYKRIGGGVLIQEKDAGWPSFEQMEIVTERQPTPKELRALDFGNRVAKWVKSNAIVYAQEDRTLGIGAGQMSRVDSAEFGLIKAQQAKLSVTGAAMASDAFFPFRDGVDAATKAGITAIIQPGGSVRDKEVIAAANEHNLAMIFTRQRHFRH